ncbi:MAG: nuclear transport factor 2 family protein [Steroidobacteraceae bacterium]
MESYSHTEAEKYIIDSSSAWAESIVTNDASVVKRILADDIAWLREGKVLDKSGAVTVAHQGSGDLVSNHLDYANVRFFGDTAVVHGSETWTRRDGHSGHFVFIDTWVRRGGIWQIVAAVDVSVPAPTGTDVCHPS